MKLNIRNTRIIINFSNPIPGIADMLFAFKSVGKIKIIRLFGFGITWAKFNPKKLHDVVVESGLVQDSEMGDG